MLADPVSTSEIQRMKQGYELLHTRLATFAHNSVTINESDTLSLSKARTDGISEGISKGISLTQSKTNSKGRYFGGSASAGVSFVVSANVGFNAGVNSSTANTTGKTNTTTETNQRSRSVTDTVSSSKTAGKSLQLTYENRSVKALLDKIDIPAESKAAFIRYTKAVTKDEVQKLRGQVVYSLFNYEIAFGLAKGKENNISSWYDYIKEMLEPDIMLLSENDQQKIIALLTKEQARIDGTAEIVDLFERLMDHI